MAPRRARTGDTTVDWYPELGPVLRKAMPGWYRIEIPARAAIVRYVVENLASGASSIVLPATLTPNGREVTVKVPDRLELPLPVLTEVA